jgi:hypothetical protein
MMLNMRKGGVHNPKDNLLSSSTVLLVQSPCTSKQVYQPTIYIFYQERMKTLVEGTDNEHLTVYE